VEDEESDEEETFDPNHELEDDPDEELPKQNQQPTQETYEKNDSAEDGSENENRSSPLKTVNPVQRTGDSPENYAP